MCLPTWCSQEAGGARRMCLCQLRLRLHNVAEHLREAHYHRVLQIAGFCGKQHLGLCNITCRSTIWLLARYLFTSVILRQRDMEYPLPKWSWILLFEVKLRPNQQSRFMVLLSTLILITNVNMSFVNTLTKVPTKGLIWISYRVCSKSRSNDLALAKWRERWWRV